MSYTDFRNFATKHLGVNGMVVDDVVKAQSGYLNPYILEERQLNVTQLDVFSRLMMDRIIFLGTERQGYKYLYQFAGWKCVCRSWYIRHHAVCEQRHTDYLYGYGCFDGCRAAGCR